jgi:hypothetical protein
MPATAIEPDFRVRLDLDAKDSGVGDYYDEIDLGSSIAVPRQ